MVQWSHFEEKQARRFIRNEIDLYGKNMEADECEGAAWQAYFEVREKYIHDLGNADYWICAARKIKCALENLRKIRNEKIKNHSNLSLYATIGENQEELISIIASKHGDFSNSAVFQMFVEGLDELKRKIIALLVHQEDDYDIIRMLRLSYDEYYREKLEIKRIFENEYL